MQKCRHFSPIRSGTRSACGFWDREPARLRIQADDRGKAAVPRNVLRDVRLQIEAGEILGSVGRSGEGKSTIAAAILGLLGLKGGACRAEIFFRGPGNGLNIDLLKLPNAQMRRLRGRHIALVPQSPLSALNPTLRLESHMQEAWRAHAKGKPACIELLQSVSLPPTREFLRQAPSSLSAGMAQRFLIALAILHHPALLIADEPTSALDTITQSDILALFRRLNRERGIAILYISHDLASVASLCHRVAILQRGLSPPPVFPKWILLSNARSSELSPVSEASGVSKYLYANTFTLDV